MRRVLLQGTGILNPGVGNDGVGSIPAGLFLPLIQTCVFSLDGDPGL
jgi:hypothetical protein